MKWMQSLIIAFILMTVQGLAQADTAVPGTYHGVGTIHQWLVTAVPDTGDMAQAIGTDWVQREAGISEAQLATVQGGPSAGDSLTHLSGWDWRVADTKIAPAGVSALDALNLNTVFQPAVNNNENSTAYLVTYITSPNARDVRLFVNSDDGIAVWLNGSLLSANPVLRQLNGETGEVVHLSLQEGKNALMLKVANGPQDWAVVGRVENAAGLLFSTDKNADGLPLALSTWTLTEPVATQPMVVVPPPPPMRHHLFWGHGPIFPVFVIFVTMFLVFATRRRHGRFCRREEEPEKPEALDAPPTMAALKEEMADLREMVADMVLAVHQPEPTSSRTRRVPENTR